MTNLVSSWLNGGVEPKRVGTAHNNVAPYQVFNTRDGFIMIGALVSALCIGTPDSQVKTGIGNDTQVCFEGI